MNSNDIVESASVMDTLLNNSKRRVEFTQDKIVSKGKMFIVTAEDRHGSLFEFEPMEMYKVSQLTATLMETGAKQITIKKAEVV